MSHLLWSLYSPTKYKGVESQETTSNDAMRRTVDFHRLGHVDQSENTGVSWEG